MEEIKQKVIVTIELNVPTDVKSEDLERETTVRSILDHWLDEGYYLEDGIINLPNGIEIGNRYIDFIEPIKHEEHPSPAIIPETKIDITAMGLMIRPVHEDGSRGEPVQIKGWVGLREVSAAGSGRWGIDLFHNGELIERLHNDGPGDNGLFPMFPHPSIARVHGELHLDMCKIKPITQIRWDRVSKSWDDVREQLMEVLKIIIDASRNYRKKNVTKPKKGVQKAKVKERD